MILNLKSQQLLSKYSVNFTQKQIETLNGQNFEISRTFEVILLETFDQISCLTTIILEVNLINWILQLFNFTKNKIILI